MISIAVIHTRKIERTRQYNSKLMLLSGLHSCTAIACLFYTFYGGRDGLCFLKWGCMTYFWVVTIRAGRYGEKVISQKLLSVYRYRGYAFMSLPPCDTPPPHWDCVAKLSNIKILHMLLWNNLIHYRVNIYKMSSDIYWYQLLRQNLWWYATICSVLELMFTSIWRHYGLTQTA